MSKRRHAGDVVHKRENAGFIGVSCTVRLLPEEPEFLGNCHCFLCDDPDCQEWSNAEVLEDGKVVSMACHVSECQMEDMP